MIDALVEDVLELSPSRREILSTVVALDRSAPVTAKEVADNLPERLDLEAGSVRNHLPELARDGLLRKRVVEVDSRGRNPTGYEARPNAVLALVEIVELRASQLRDARVRVEGSRRVLPDGWSTVGEQEDLGGSRYAGDSPFCTECGSVWAGDGPCDDCREGDVGEAVADGGERP